MNHYFIEAESFEKLGGWVIDAQSMHQMGSAYVMAHGMGAPVEDAETTVEIETSGVYAVWVRTRDWAAVWGRGSAPGLFTVMINGQELPKVLGNEGEKWAWHKAGEVTLEKGVTHLALHDLTGFNGRCDAIYFTNNLDEVPEQDNEKLKIFRREKCGIEIEEMPDTYDLVVAGGGMAGICTAITAIRMGMKVALISDRPLLGGCNSSDIRVGMGGRTHIGRYPELGNVVREITPIIGSGGTHEKEWYEDVRKHNVFLLHNPSQYTLALNESVVAVERDPLDNKRIVSVIARSTITGKEKRYRASLFADCTGDGFLARTMGCEAMYGREGKSQFNEQLAPEKADNQVMGHSVIWYAKDQGRPSAFPEVDWGIEFTEETALYIRRGDWDWETGQYRDMVNETEYIRDYGLMAIFANWSFIKNHSSRKDEFANDRLDWISPIGGKRESCRIVGDYILTQNEIEAHDEKEDATASMSWSIDLHFPDPGNEEKFDEPFRSCAYHRDLPDYYAVPYRCLYARDVKNLFLGGRIISLSHIAFASARVMRTLGMLGEVIGLAASICKRHNCNPRDIYTNYLDELIDLMHVGVPTPYYHNPDRGVAEAFHFKDEGWFRLYPTFTIPKDDLDIRRKIRKLGIVYKNEVPEV